MAQVVAAFGVSHAAIMLRAWERAPTAQKEAVGAGFKAIRERLYAARPDTLLLIGNDHFNSFFLESMPAYCLGVGASCRGHGDGGLPAYEMKIDQPLAEELLEGLLHSGFAPAFSTDLRVDHSFITPLHLLTEREFAIVPLFQNCNAPPQPTLQSCFELGRALRRLIDGSAMASRVAVIGTGGLSHQIPTPNWRDLARSGERPARLEQMTHGGKRFDPVIRQAIAEEVNQWSREGRGFINEKFDRFVLELMAAGKYQELSGYSTEQIEREGGNGAQEIRNWMTMLGLVSERRAEIIFYQAVVPWLTGVAGIALAP
jgi:2,3-dihydroxyphenylpropionate 1,2-dioxygenase